MCAFGILRGIHWTSLVGFLSSHIDNDSFCVLNTAVVGGDQTSSKRIGLVWEMTPAAAALGPSRARGTRSEIRNPFCEMVEVRLIGGRFRGTAFEMCWRLCFVFWGGGCGRARAGRRATAPASRAARCGHEAQHRVPRERHAEEGRDQRRPEAVRRAAARARCARRARSLARSRAAAATGALGQPRSLSRLRSCVLTRSRLPPPPPRPRRRPFFDKRISAEIPGDSLGDVRARCPATAPRCARGGAGRGRLGRPCPSPQLFFFFLARMRARAPLRRRARGGSVGHARVPPPRVAGQSAARLMSRLARRSVRGDGWGSDAARARRAGVPSPRARPLSVRFFFPPPG